ncbi:MAG: rhodanese-like domain-containing protein [Pseudomonadota bacterium]
MKQLVMSLVLAVLLLPRSIAAPLDQLRSDALDGIDQLTTAQLQQRLTADPGTWLIDVRTPEELVLSGGTIDAMRNLNLPRGWIEYRIGDAVTDKNAPIVVYCGQNLRSPLAAARLREMGYTNVSNYADGFQHWRDQGLAVEQLDKAPQSMLYSMPIQVSDNVWSAIGATAPPTYANSGHNNNLSFIIGDEAVLVVNAGDNALLARALHEEIRKLTDLPVRYVALENGQGHAMLGTGYWQDQGAEVIAHTDAIDEIESYGADILDRMQRGRRDKASGTELSLPDRGFDDYLELDLGGERVHLMNLGPAHSPGDIVVWLPDQRMVISGDLAFHERLLPVFEHTDTAAWIETWSAFEALGADTVIPGHGGPTTVPVVRQFTHDYLVDLRAKIGAHLDDGGNLAGAYYVDQSAWEQLDTWRELARRNAGRVFEAMEFE